MDLKYTIPKRKRSTMQSDTGFQDYIIVKWNKREMFYSAL